MDEARKWARKVAYGGVMEIEEALIEMYERLGALERESEKWNDWWGEVGTRLRTLERQVGARHWVSARSGVWTDDQGRTGHVVWPEGNDARNGPAVFVPDEPASEPPEGAGEHTSGAYTLDDGAVVLTKRLAVSGPSDEWVVGLVERAKEDGFALSRSEDGQWWVHPPGVYARMVRSGRAMEKLRADNPGMYWEYTGPELQTWARREDADDCTDPADAILGSDEA